MKPRDYLLLFWLNSALLLIASAIHTPILYGVSKLLIVISLLGYYISKNQKRSWVFISALASCWLGDGLLLFPEYFIGGLIAFLAGHILYIIAYRSHRTFDHQFELLPTQKMRFSLPVILAGTGLIAVLFPKLGALQFPVLIYAVVLMLMVMTAIFRYGRTNSESFWLVLIGAILFMASDSLLAINKFYAPIPFGNILVMVTYMSAQYFIVVGIAKASTG